jgi:hypothetical protein
VLFFNYVISHCFLRSNGRRLRRTRCQICFLCGHNLGVVRRRQVASRCGC